MNEQQNEMLKSTLMILFFFFLMILNVIKTQKVCLFTGSSSPCQEDTDMVIEETF